jgi:2-phosphoglycerate kinase
MNPVLIAAVTTGLLGVFGAIVAAPITSDKLIVTDLFRWRRPFKRSTVILINDGSGAGKTTLAWALARKFNIASVFGTDLLREAVRFCKDQSDSAKDSQIFRSSFETGSLFRDQCEDICGPLLKIIKRIRRKRDPEIIEWVNIMASQVFKEIPLDAGNGVYFINLHIEDPEIHEQRLRDRGNTSYEDSHETERYIKNIEAVRTIDQFLMIDAAQFAGKGALVRCYENSKELSRVVDQIEKDIKIFRRTNKLRKREAGI